MGEDYDHSGCCCEVMKTVVIMENGEINIGVWVRVRGKPWRGNNEKCAGQEKKEEGKGE